MKICEKKLSNSPRYSNKYYFLNVNFYNSFKISPDAGSAAVSSLTLELGFDLPGVRGEAPEHLPLCVFDEQQSGSALRQAGHHPGEALAVQPSGKHKSPGGAVAVRQLERLT